MRCSFCSLLYLDFSKASKIKLEPKYVEDSCEECLGNAKKALMLIEQLDNHLENHRRTFGIATVLPKDLLASENRFLDRRVCFKALLNHFAKNKLSKLNVSLSKTPEILLTLNLKENTITRSYENILILAKYLKNCRNVSQNYWPDPKNPGSYKYVSITQILEKSIKKIFPCKRVVLHANGREDVDVKMLGNGRYCAIEIVMPQRPFEEKLLKTLEEEINNTGKEHNITLKLIRKINVRDLELIKESEFEKHYEAVVVTKHSIDEKDIDKMNNSFNNVVISQKTPLRVIKRRANLTRKKLIRTLCAKMLDKKTFKLYVVCQSGTYVKELISGDQGRTVPSISSVLNKECRCKKLNVVWIDDYFIDSVIRLKQDERNVYS